MDDDSYESVLSIDWHPFYDARGVKFYHNFVTGERMRQSPRRVPSTNDPGAESTVPKPSAFNTMSQPGSPQATMLPKVETTTLLTQGSKAFGSTAGRKSQQEPLPLKGFDALETLPLA